jgi:hypothetical protein
MGSPFFNERSSNEQVKVQRAYDAQIGSPEHAARMREMSDVVARDAAARLTYVMLMLGCDEQAARKAMKNY